MDEYSFDLAIAGGTVMTSMGRVAADIGVRDGRIAALGDLGRAAAAERFDASGLHVLPGAIDTQVHFREPGLEHKEDLESGTRGAAKGGVTAILEMPNTSPNTDSAEALSDKLRRAQGRTWCDYAFFLGATDGNAGELATLERLPGCAGVKVFMGSSTGSLLVADDETLRKVLAGGQPPGCHPRRGRSPVDRAQGAARPGRRGGAASLSARCRGGGPRDPAHPGAGPRDRPARSCAAHLDRGRTAPAGGKQGRRDGRDDASAPHPSRRRNATSGGAATPR